MPVVFCSRDNNFFVEIFYSVLGDLTKTGTTTSKDTIDGVQAPQPFNPELLSLLSSVFDDSACSTQLSTEDC